MRDGRLSDNLDSPTHKMECDRKLKEEKIHRSGEGGERGDLTFRTTRQHLLRARRYRGVAFRRDSTFTCRLIVYFPHKAISRINDKVK